MAQKSKEKPLIELDKRYGKPIAYWESIAKAASFYNLKTANISAHVTGRQQQANGHFFRYATPKETEEYNKNLARIDAAINAQATPVEINNTIPTTPPDTIPETVKQTEKQDDTLSPFDAMLQKCKNLFNENSK